jgi:hypothetical protein
MRWGYGIVASGAQPTLNHEVHMKWTANEDHLPYMAITPTADPSSTPYRYEEWGDASHKRQKASQAKK